MEGALYSAFQHRKVKRYLAMHGEPFTFSRRTKNVYGELTDEAEYISVTGRFYTQNNQKGFWLLNSFDETRVRYKRYLTNFILVDYEQFELNPIQMDDEVTVNGKRYVVTGVTNIQEANFAVNISLDVVLSDPRTLQEEPTP